MNEKIKVLVVENLPTAKLFLVQILNSDPRLLVLGTANTGAEALEFIRRYRPDIVLMDYHLPDMDGYETSRRIMETLPVPIVVCSATHNGADVADTFRAMQAGALALVSKPLDLEGQDGSSAAHILVETVRAMSEVKVVRRWPRKRRSRTSGNLGSTLIESPAPRGSFDVIAIGASTGGPPAIQAILSDLPKNFPIPIMIVQHIAPGFIAGLAEWLERTTGFACRLAAHSESLRPAHAYLAPDGFHLGLMDRSRARLSQERSETGLCPSVAHLFRSVAAICASRAIGVLLTGMGRDGACELKLMKDSGAITIVQNAATSAVHGMPGEAIKLGAASHVLAPPQISALLSELITGDPHRHRVRVSQDNSL